MIFDYLLLLLQGFMAGLLVSITPGPVAVICIQRTINGDFKNGFISGLGVATADTVFALLAAFLLAYVNSFLADKMFILQVVAGILVMVMGFSTYMKKVRRPNRSGSVKGATLTSNFLSTFLITITNPLYFLPVTAIFAGTGVGAQVEESFVPKLILISGVFIGAVAWWFLLTGGISKIRHKFSVRTMWWINRIAGITIIVLGAGLILLTLLQVAELI